MRFDRSSFMGDISVKSLIRWLPDRSINENMDAYRRTQIDGGGDKWYLFQIPDFNIHLSINQSINVRKKRREGQISKTSYRGMHWKERNTGWINMMDGCKNRQNTMPKIPAITIPTIPAINIDFHQHIKSLTEGRIYRKGDVSTGYRTD